MATGTTNVGFEEKFVTYAEYKKLLQRYRVNLIETENIIDLLLILHIKDKHNKSN